MMKKRRVLSAGSGVAGDCGSERWSERKSERRPEGRPERRPKRRFELARRQALLAGAAAMAGLAQLAGCAGAPVPPTTWLRLSADAPSLPAAGPAPVSPSAAREVWQLMLPLPLPAHLERDSLFIPQGAAGASVRPLAGARWVEPLRDALPRLLREDLVRQMGGQPLWWSPLPPGVAPTRQLRVEIMAFEIGAAGQSLLTRARWSIADVRGARPPFVHETGFESPSARAGDAEAWAVAHRQAIATLAARIAVTLNTP